MSGVQANHWPVDGIFMSDNHKGPTLSDKRLANGQFGLVTHRTVSGQHNAGHFPVGPLAVVLYSYKFLLQRIGEGTHRAVIWLCRITLTLEGLLQIKNLVDVSQFFL